MNTYNTSITGTKWLPIQDYSPVTAIQLGVTDTLSLHQKNANVNQKFISGKELGAMVYVHDEGITHLAVAVSHEPDSPWVEFDLDTEIVPTMPQEG